MTVVALPTSSTRMWHRSTAALEAAVMNADHPRLHEHLRAAGRLASSHGVVTRPWADRLAAMVVISSRRADTAPTRARRASYLDVASAATHLLRQAADLHGVRPGSDAMAVLAQIRPADSGAMLG